MKTLLQASASKFEETLYRLIHENIYEAINPLHRHQTRALKWDEIRTLNSFHQISFVKRRLSDRKNYTSSVDTDLTDFNLTLLETCGIPVKYSMQSFLQTTISNISSGFSSNSEAFASELLENPEEVFPRYYIHSDQFQPHTVLPLKVTRVSRYLTLYNVQLILKNTDCNWETK